MLPLTQRQKHLLIVAPGVVRGIDHEKPELPGVRAAMQVHHGHGVRVVPSRARWRGHELIPPSPVGRYGGSAFFLRPIHFRGDQ